MAAVNPSPSAVSLACHLAAAVAAKGSAASQACQQEVLSSQCCKSCSISLRISSEYHWGSLLNKQAGPAAEAGGVLIGLRRVGLTVTSERLLTSAHTHPAHGGSSSSSRFFTVLQLLPLINLLQPAMLPGWGPGAFGGFPAGLFGDQQLNAPYSDDEDYFYRGNRWVSGWWLGPAGLAAVCFVCNAQRLL